MPSITLELVKDDFEDLRMDSRLEGLFFQNEIYDYPGDEDDELVEIRLEVDDESLRYIEDYYMRYLNDESLDAIDDSSCDDGEASVFSEASSVSFLSAEMPEPDSVTPPPKSPLHINLKLLSEDDDDVEIDLDLEEKEAAGELRMICADVCRPSALPWVECVPVEGWVDTLAAKKNATHTPSVDSSLAGTVSYGHRVLEKPEIFSFVRALYLNDLSFFGKNITVDYWGGRLVTDDAELFEKVDGELCRVLTRKCARSV